MEQEDKRKSRSGGRRRGKWLGGVLLDSALTGSAPYTEKGSSLRRLATDITAAWDRREDLQEAPRQTETGIHDCADNMLRLDASLVLHEQRGKRLDPMAAKSITECENLLDNLLQALEHHDANAEGGTQEIDDLVDKIEELHLEIDAALEA